MGEKMRAINIKNSIFIVVTATTLGMAACAIPAANAETSGAVIINIHQTFSEPVGTVVVTGAIGDFGTAQGADAAGRPSKLSPAPVVLLKLRKGTILLDATNTNQATSTSPLVQNISCSFSLSATTVPLPIIKGTGAYKAVKGSLTASIDLGGITPFYKTGANKGKCDFSNKYLPLASYFNEVAYGTITY